MDPNSSGHPNGRPASSASSSNGVNGALTAEAMDRMMQNATYGVQMLNAALRHTQSGMSAVGVSPSSLAGNSSGAVGMSSITTNSLAMANTMPPAPPSTSGSSASSSTSHYPPPHGHTSNAHGPHSNSTSPKLNPKEESRMVEDGPVTARGMKTESASGKEGANGSGGGAAATGGATNDRVKRQVCVFLTCL